MSIEIAVKVSNSERTLTEKHLLTEDHNIYLRKDDPTLNALVAQATKAFGEQAEDVLLKIKLQW